MREDLKQGLTAAAGVMLVTTALTLWRRHQWNGPTEKAEGRVLSCKTGTDGEGRGTYTTQYEFKDGAGVQWKLATSGMSYCLPPGSVLNVEWLQGRPDTARAWEKK